MEELATIDTVQIKHTPIELCAFLHAKCTAIYCGCLPVQIGHVITEMVTRPVQINQSSIQV